MVSVALANLPQPSAPISFMYNAHHLQTFQMILLVQNFACGYAET